ncbi:MAG TPA: FIST N-terminal domain-containing protein, partial [Solirubrobacteraceae bacterium]|nr:FIST N-terminal domain-containing protein [Solirubrobacteraceae bacterium]
DVLHPDTLAGCSAGGVLAGAREVEGGTAVAVWAADLAGGSAEAFHIQTEPTEDGVAVTGLPDLAGAACCLLLPDPLSFPTEGILDELHRRAGGVPVLGGLASARTTEGTAALFCDDRVVGVGAVGLRLDGVELLPCVSQGAVAIGPELTVTAGGAQRIEELDGVTALVALRNVMGDLSGPERARARSGLLLGMRMGEATSPAEAAPSDAYQLVGLAGAEQATGALAIGAAIEPGMRVRLHVRDADSADRDLHQALALRRAALGEQRPAGALMFTCNGRGAGLFGAPDHDARVLAEELDVPAAGFFAAGEIGPVGGRPALHGFTATVAVFAGG